MCQDADVDQLNFFETVEFLAREIRSAQVGENLDEVVEQLGREQQRLELLNAVKTRLSVLNALTEGAQESLTFDARITTDDGLVLDCGALTLLDRVGSDW